MRTGAGECAATRSGHRFRHPGVQPVHRRSISGILDLALVGQRRSNCRYSDFAVTAVEIWLVAATLVVELRRIVLSHALLHGLFTFARWAYFAADRDGEGLRPKCATNRVLS